MKKSVAMKWIKALRSGKYKQAKGRLRRVDSFCCLGVLCDISGKGTWASLLFTAPGASPGVASVPCSVRDWAGLKDILGRVDLPGGSVCLSELNDIRNRSFKQIAAFIERNWEKL